MKETKRIQNNKTIKKAVPRILESAKKYIGTNKAIKKAENGLFVGNFGGK